MRDFPNPLLAFPARRTVFNAEALAWLDAHPAPEGTSIFTSLPDLSELPALDFAGWRSWFTGAARRLLRWLPEDGVAVFFQSDIRHGGAWVDKSYLIQEAVAAEGGTLVWHKIVCRRPPGSISQGRSTYSHLVCFSRVLRPAPRRPGPDVLPDAGPMPWPRAIGATACRVVCRFLRDETATTIIVDPFCGRGSVLAVANAFGFEAVGVDLSPRRCRFALRQRFGADAAAKASVNPSPEG